MLSAPPETAVYNAVGAVLCVSFAACMFYIVLSFAWEVFHAPRHRRG